MEKSIENQAYDKFIADYRKYYKMQSRPRYLCDLMIAAMYWKTKNIKMTLGSIDGKNKWAAYPILQVCKAIIHAGEFDIMEIMNGKIEIPEISDSNIQGVKPGFENDKPF